MIPDEDLHESASGRIVIAIDRRIARRLRSRLYRRGFPLSRSLPLSRLFTIRRAIIVVIAICRGVRRSTRVRQQLQRRTTLFFRWAILRHKYYGRNNVILGRNERRR